MPAIVCLFVASCVISLAVTPVFRTLFSRLRIVDVPDGTRKLHRKPIPRAGGVPIALSYLGAVGVLVLTSSAALPMRHAKVFWSASPAVALIFGIGLIDDAIGLKPKIKLGAQILAAALACAAGVQITSIADHPAASWWAIPLTIVWLVVCTNAINLVDGLDGLAAGVALFTTIAALVAALAQNNMGLALATAPLAGALLGFLRYNFHPASVFLGDCGSLTIGFLLGCFSIVWSQKSATLLGMAAPIIALSLPLVDVGLAVTRRFLGNRPIFVADARHIHHRLVARGLSPRRAALLLYGVCGTAAGLSLIQSILYKDIGALAVIALCGCIWVGVRALDYVEFRAARELVTTGRLRKVLEEEIHLKTLEGELSRTRSVQDCWPFLRDCCRKLGFHSVRLQSSSEAFEQIFLQANHLESWQFKILISTSHTLTLDCSCHNHELVPLLPLVETLRSAISRFEPVPARKIASATESYAVDAFSSARSATLTP